MKCKLNDAEFDCEREKIGSAFEMSKPDEDGKRAQKEVELFRYKVKGPNGTVEVLDDKEFHAKYTLSGAK